MAATIECVVVIDSSYNNIICDCKVLFVLQSISRIIKTKNSNNKYIKNIIIVDEYTYNTLMNSDYSRELSYIDFIIIRDNCEEITYGNITIKNTITNAVNYINNYNTKYDRAYMFGDFTLMSNIFMTIQCYRINLIEIAYSCYSKNKNDASICSRYMDYIRHTYNKFNSKNYNERVSFLCDDGIYENRNTDITYSYYYIKHKHESMYIYNIYSTIICNDFVYDKHGKKCLIYRRSKYIYNISSCIYCITNSNEDMDMLLNEIDMFTSKKIKNINDNDCDKIYIERWRHINIEIICDLIGSITYIEDELDVEIPLCVDNTSIRLIYDEGELFCKIYVDQIDMINEYKLLLTGYMLLIVIICAKANAMRTYMNKKKIQLGLISLIIETPYIYEDDIHDIGSILCTKIKKSDIIYVNSIILENRIALDGSIDRRAFSYVKKIES